MANRHRGEIELQLHRKKVVLRPTFEALAEIQEVLAPRSFTEFLMELSANRFSVRDLALIVQAAGVWKQDKPNLEQIGDWVERVGWLVVANKIADLLTYALLGQSANEEIETDDDDESGEAKAERPGPTLSAVISE